MTTDPATADDRAARLVALRQRRTASRADGDTSAAGTPAPRQSRRRRHAATGARILAGSLSASAALGLMAAMANAADPSSDAPPITTTDATAAPTVVVVRRLPGATDVAAPAARRVTPAVAAPVTASRGS